MFIFQLILPHRCRTCCYNAVFLEDRLQFRQWFQGGLYSVCSKQWRQIKCNKNDAQYSFHNHFRRYSLRMLIHLKRHLLAFHLQWNTSDFRLENARLVCLQPILLWAQCKSIDCISGNFILYTEILGSECHRQFAVWIGKADLVVCSWLKYRSIQI